MLVKYLSDELTRRGHEVHVLCDPRVYASLRGNREAGDSGSWMDIGVKVHTTKDTGIATHPLRSLMFNTVGKSRSAIERIVRSIKPDVIHWHNTRAFVNIPFSIPGSAKHLYTAHDYYLVCPRSNLVRPNMKCCEIPYYCSLCTVMWRRPPQLWRLMKNRVIKPHQGIGILTPSVYVANRLRLDGLTVDRVVRNFVPDAAESSLQDNVDGDFAEAMLLYIGMLEPHKGISTLLRAFSRTRASHEFHLVIVGRGTQQNEVLKLVRRLGLSDRVDLLGYVNPSVLRHLRRHAMLQVVPSQWPENAPLTIMESFSAGLPVLGSDAGGIPEMVNSESGSFLFKAADIPSLSQSLLYLWQKRSELQACGRQARQAYLRHYSPEVHLRNYMAVIASYGQSEGTHF